MPLRSHIDWLDRDVFIAEVRAAGGLPGRPQAIVLPIAVPDLLEALPTAPAENPDEEDFPGPVQRWYGRAGGGRYFTLDLEASIDDVPVRSCVVTTTYPDGGEHDWTTLRALAGLGEVVHLDQVVFVQSRGADERPFVVYRRDPRGFDAPVYSTASRDDAASLAAFLTCEQNPCGYFLGGPDPRGKWVVVEDAPAPRAVACYTDRVSSLMVACRMTRGNEQTLRVRDDAAGSERQEYTVRGGRVVWARWGPGMTRQFR